MKVVSFVNMKGGVAKTTLAVNIADCLVKRHQLKILIIDTDPQFNATQCLITGQDYIKKLKKGAHTVINIFDDSPRPISSSVKGSKILDPVSIENIEPWNLSDNFFIVPGALELYRLDMGGGQGREIRLKRYVDYLRSNSDYHMIIIDTPPTPSAWMSSALIASDYYLIPVKPEPLSATGIDLLKAVVDRVKTNYDLKLECAGVVLTIAEEHTIVYQNTVAFIDGSKFWKGKRYNYSLPKRTEIARNQGNQKMILDTNDKPLKKSLAEITKELLEKIGLII